MNTGFFFSAHTERTASRPWGDFHKVHRIRITDYTFNSHIPICTLRAAPVHTALKCIFAHSGDCCRRPVSSSEVALRRDLFTTTEILCDYSPPVGISGGAKISHLKSSSECARCCCCLCVSQFSRCFLYMIRCSSEAPPTPGHHTLPSSRGVWLHTPNPPTEEQNTAPAMFTSRGQQVQRPALVLVAQYAT